MKYAYISKLNGSDEYLDHLIHAHSGVKLYRVVCKGHIQCYHMLWLIVWVQVRDMQL